jgi:hypothetical protein
MFGIGGSNKKNSSSWILEAWKANEWIRACWSVWSNE